MMAARANRIINATLPPFPIAFLVAIDTIPPVSINNATTTPMDPDDPPFASMALTTPAAQDCNATTKNNTMDKIPATNFQVLTTSFLSFYCVLI